MSGVNLSAVIKKLQEKGVIVYPTDTLYALGADIFDDEAVRKIFFLNIQTGDHFIISFNCAKSSSRSSKGCPFDCILFITDSNWSNRCGKSFWT